MKFWNKKLLKVVAAVVVIVIGVGVGGWRLWASGQNRRVFAVIQQQLSYPLLYPAHLPNGYKLATNKPIVRGEVVIYEIIGPNNKHLATSEQAFPKAFDQGQLKGNQEFTTNLGKAYIVAFDDRTTASLVAGKTWVIINFPGAMDTEDMKLILKGFEAL